MPPMTMELIPEEHAAWLRPLLPAQRDAPAAPEQLMDLALAIAEANPARGGGPFGAVVADAGGRLVALGWNDVLPETDSTAHAEITAIRRAQRTLGSHDLARAGELLLYASCEPCIQCFGAIWWSGLREVRAAASSRDAHALGFCEGPARDALWAEAARVKGLRWRPGFGDVERAVAALRAYAGAGERY